VDFEIQNVASCKGNSSELAIIGWQACYKCLVKFCSRCINRKQHRLKDF